jgi:coenzyme F420-reducing hydrogenase beta subunit
MNELDKIIKGGYCIGCGTCASACPSNIKMIENKEQKYEAKVFKELDDSQLTKALKVCSFSNEGLNEDEIGEKVFDLSEVSKGDVIGYYKSLYAGHVVADDLRSKATSGGIITWTLDQLLKNNLIDAVIHVKGSEKEGTIFEYGISKTTEEIIQGAKSRYYPVELSEVMEYVLKNDLRFAFVGLPCFVKSARKYAMVDPVINERLKFFVGLVCGHLKSKAFAEYVGWQAGITPGELKYIDFRYKIPDKPADSYGIQVEDKQGNKKVMVAKETLGTNWGLGYFKYEACDYCDDIFSETADIAVGDAWLKHYTKDSKGNSVVISRNKTIDLLLEKGIQTKELQLDVLSDEAMRDAQGGGFRHRRVALGYRLYLKQKKNLWFPHKRVKVDKNSISGPYKLIFRFRVYIRDKSTEYWMKSRESGNFMDFEKKMKLPGQVYQMLLNGVGFIKKIKK